ncbi:two-component sensor histidine kinase [Shouchella clausii]|uniref:sensor histidine kinase n=1 Tax=Shouchella TaxID=2893057 RepID=UPI000BA76AE3|nr:MULTISPECIES: HAMP domain-containing sensor histidine kinase [Shouchella]MCM3381531.1 HAMP domain-containing histidine kinase [Shouchella rhizosphaerae]PAE79210.1 two-component sensor histidine kinase [Shouchella clausii]
MGIGKSNKTLRRELIFYMLTLGVSLTMVAALYLLLHIIALNAGFVYPANHYEREAENLRPSLEKVEQVTDNMIPEMMSYAIFDKELNVKAKGTLSDKSLQTVQSMLTNEPYTNHIRQTGYMVVERPDEIGVIEYPLRAEFRSPFLRQHLPNYELTSIALLVILLIATAFAVTTHFANRMKKQFKKLHSITKQIQEQNLDFTPEFSKIKEFDEIIDSLLEMKQSLQHSLNTQWHMEKAKGEQIGALAHDLKIPVTVIKGNAELLSLSGQQEEQSAYTHYILNAVHKIEQYISQLIHLSHTDGSLPLTLRKTDLAPFVEMLLADASAYKGSKNVKIVCQKNELTAAEIDQHLLHRALLNIVTNAIDYTPEQGSIFIEAACTPTTFHFTVTDTGKGFSAEALKRATELFFMEEKSRHTNNHYGIGLTFASNVAKLHNGSLSIENAASGGGSVYVAIPITAKNGNEGMKME